MLATCQHIRINKYRRESLMERVAWHDSCRPQARACLPSFRKIVARPHLIKTLAVTTHLPPKHVAAPAAPTFLKNTLVSLPFVFWPRPLLQMTIFTESSPNLRLLSLIAVSKVFVGLLDAECSKFDFLVDIPLPMCHRAEFDPFILPSGSPATQYGPWVG